MEVKNYFAQDDKGNILPNASVYLYKKGTNELVSVFDKNGSQKTNPFTAEINGLVQFSAADGDYDLRISSGGRDYKISISLLDTLRLHFEAVARNIGCTLATGSFDDGAVITDPNQLVLDKGKQKIYQYTRTILDGIAVMAGTDPVVGGNWRDVTDESIDDKFVKFASQITDFTGATDYTAYIADLFSRYDCVKLPETGFGSFRADITVPAGKTLIGSGRQNYNRIPGVWNGKGTLVKGLINQASIDGFCIGNLSVDNYSSGRNAISGTTATTGHGYIKNVATRANNHGMLFEANDSDAENSNAIGHIVAEDCLHYGGPNGFVSKHKNVSFIRCDAYDVTVQSHVVVSDNINGAGVFSRAQKTVLIDCNAYFCNEGLRIYSRNYHGGIDTVFGAYDTFVQRYSGNSFAGRKIRIGDFATTATAGGFTRVASIVNRFRDLPYDATNYSCYHIEYADRTDFKGCHWGFQQNISVGDSYGQIDCNQEDNNIRAGSSLSGVTALGVESGILYVSDNSATIVPSAKQQLIVLQNTVTTQITNIGNATIGYEVTVLIDDAFSSLTLSGVRHSGKGTVCRFRYNGTSWDDLGELRQLTKTERTAGSGTATATFDFSTGNMSQLFAANGVNITSVVLSNTSKIQAGDDIVLRITTNASAITITGWDAAIKWADGATALSALSGYRKAIIKMYCVGGGVFVVTSTTIYV